ncbi:hypothetical protein BX666DRAFT_2028858 [Dichotomocladium elegans]|nr:hypothetical protein BX666DRAFT_2028858 [Dichotomocladium elegans]
MDKDLESFGYIHHRSLTVTDCNAIAAPRPSSFKRVPDSLCVYFDLVVKDSLLDSIHYDKLYGILSSDATKRKHARRGPSAGFSKATVRRSAANATEQQRHFIQNDERRDNLISEFVCTEDSYVANLRAFVSSIVQPIRSRAKDKQQSILGLYECNKIFMNIEQILQANEAFRLDLARYQSMGDMDFGEICLMHASVENAQAFNIKEQKNNATYETYLNKLKVNKGNQTVYDYLALPGQRVGRYTMFLKELIKHTTDDHPNLPGLTQALKTAEEIADMSEDYHTTLIKIFRNMLQSIQNCPASLISQQRSLICHLDAVEHDLSTGKPTCPVTLFLFTDKLLVARRPSYAADGLELCGLDQEKDKSGMLSLLVRKADLTKRYDRKLKFRGWMGLNDLEIHDGIEGIQGSFTLVASANETVSLTELDPQTRDALEGYFLEGAPRLFSLVSNTLSDSGTAKSAKSILQDRQTFVEQFGKSKLEHQRANDDHLLEWAACIWKDRYFFTSIYRLSTYQLIQNKNEIAFVLSDDPESPALMSALSNSFITPHMLGFVQPTHGGSRFSVNVRSKLALGCIADTDDKCRLEALVDSDMALELFRDRLLGNLYACDRDLREVGRIATTLGSYGRRRAQHHHHQQQSPIKSTIRKEMSRRRSMTTFKLFGGLGSPPTTPSASTSIATPLTAQRRRKSVGSNEYPHAQQGFLESRISNHTYSSTSTRSNDSQCSLSASEEKLSAEGSRMDVKKSPMQIRRKSLTESIASMYRPSVHPSQSMSYELLTGTRPEISRSSNPMPNEAEVLGDRVKQMCTALQKQMRSPLSSNEEGAATISPSTAQQRLARPESYSPASRKSWSGPPISDSFRSVHNNQPDKDFLPCVTGPTTPLSHDIFFGNASTQEQFHADERVTELLAHIKNQSPLSSSSSESCQTPPLPPPPPLATVAGEENAIEKLIIEMETMKSEFNRKYTKMIEDYEEMGGIVRQFTRDLQKKDEELSTMRMRYRNAMIDNEMLYESFNHELDQLYDMFSLRQHPCPEEICNNSNESRPQSSSSSSELLIQKKLELTIKERNQWHQTACKLAREIQNLSQDLMMDSNSNNDIRPIRSTSSPSKHHHRRSTAN